MDLYTRLEELQGMTRLLIDDVSSLRGELGAGAPDPSAVQQTNRRFYVRAVFALVEAFAEQHRRLLLDLAGEQKIAIRAKDLTALQEMREVTLPDGSIELREQYLKLFQKIKTVYKTAGDGFEQKLKIVFGDKGWTTFLQALELRNQVTHPKQVSDCWIFEAHLQTVTAANDWFTKLQNEFVRVAREHRERRRW